MKSFEGLLHHLNHSFFYMIYFKGYIYKNWNLSPVQYICTVCTLNQRLTFLSFLPVNWIEFAQHHRKVWEQRLNYIPNAFKAAAAVSHELNTGTSIYILRLVLYSQTMPRCTFISNETIRERNRPIEMCLVCLRS